MLTTHITRHIEAIDHIARAHVYRFGDGGAHLLPEYPEAPAGADAAIVAAEYWVRHG